jgi:hypothetical protein
MNFYSKKEIFRFFNHCSLKIKLPFFKKVLIATNNRNWLKLDNLVITAMSLRKGFQPIFLKYNGERREDGLSWRLEAEDIRKIRYKGINLYDVTIYQICVELQVFLNDLDLSDTRHIHVVQEWFRRAVAFIDYILPYFKKTRLHKVIILQGYLYDSAIIRRICIERGIPVVAVENTLNKDKIIWDDISCISVNQNLAANFYWRYRDVIDSRSAKKYCMEYIANIKTKKQDEHFSPDKQLLLDSGKKSIFFIGQVFTDASTLFGIGKFHNPVSIIEYLVKYAIKEDYNLIVKLHPKELDGSDILQNRYDSLTHRQIKANAPLYNSIKTNKNIYYDYENAYDTYSIIQNSDVCVTINSQAGLESLLLGKKVVTCGNAFYNCLNSVFQATDESHMVFLLDRLLRYEAPEADLNQVYKFFYIFCEKYCLPKNEKSFLSLFERTIVQQGQR